MKNQQSILLVGNFLSGHSQTRSVCEDLAQHLAAAGWNVITTSHKIARLSRLVDMLQTVSSKRNQYEIATIDIFSNLSFFWAECVSTLFRRLRKPFILILHGGNLPAFANKQPNRVRNLLKSATKVVVPSNYLLKELSPYHPALHLIPNAIDIHKYSCRLREQPGEKLIWLRAFHSIYNPAMAVQAYGKLLEKYPKMSLKMIGPVKDNDCFREVKNVAGDLNVPGQIEFPGGVPKSDISKWLNDGDIFINTTNVDNVPISVIEAMASGLCIVNTDVGGIPYLLAHEQDALLVSPNAPEEMANAVQRILTQPELARRLSSNARKKAEGFDWSEVLPQWEELLLNAIGKNNL